MMLETSSKQKKNLAGISSLRSECPSNVDNRVSRGARRCFLKSSCDLALSYSPPCRYVSLRSHNLYRRENHTLEIFSHASSFSKYFLILLAEAATSLQNSFRFVDLDCLNQLGGFVYWFFVGGESL